VLKIMLLSQLKKALTALLLLVVFGLGGGLMTALAPSRSEAAGEDTKATKDKPTAGFTLAQFKALKPVLDIKTQPWTTIPWKYSITEARKLAAATKKPIFMVINTGNALGCT
jgi:CBS domain-containing protein